MTQNKWSESALIRKHQIESGLDITFHRVFVPEFVEILSRFSPHSVLDVGAGTGHLARVLQKYCDELVAIEPSNGMYRVAKDTLLRTNVTLIHADSYSYRSHRLFDLAYSHMCAHTIGSIDEFFTSIRNVMRSGGVCVFSIPHPLFYVVEKNYFGKDFTYFSELYKDVDLTISEDKMNRMRGLPYYHRPLSTYINCFIKSGFTVLSVNEVWPDEKIRREYSVPWSGPRYCIISGVANTRESKDKA